MGPRIELVGRCNDSRGNEIPFFPVAKGRTNEICERMHLCKIEHIPLNSMRVSARKKTPEKKQALAHFLERF